MITYLFMSSFTQMCKSAKFNTWLLLCMFSFTYISFFTLFTLCNLLLSFISFSQRRLLLFKYCPLFLVNILFLQVIIFLYYKLLVMLSQFRYKNSNPHFFISGQMRSVCSTSFFRKKRGQVLSSVPLLNPPNFQIPVFIHALSFITVLVHDSVYSSFSHVCFISSLKIKTKEIFSHNIENKFCASTSLHLSLMTVPNLFVLSPC